MLEKEEIKQEESNLHEKVLYCEKYQEWVKEDQGCKHKGDYCQFRKRCLIALREKFKDF